MTSDRSQAAFVASTDSSRWTPTAPPTRPTVTAVESGGPDRWFWVSAIVIVAIAAIGAVWGQP